MTHIYFRETSQWLAGRPPSLFSRSLACLFPSELLPPPPPSHSITPLSLASMWSRADVNPVPSAPLLLLWQYETLALKRWFSAQLDPFWNRNHRLRLIISELKVVTASETKTKDWGRMMSIGQMRGKWHLDITRGWAPSTPKRRLEPLRNLTKLNKINQKQTHLGINTCKHHMN